MRAYICPECGREVKNKFCVSIGGLFLSKNADDVNEYSVYAFLNDNVVINRERLKACKSFKIINDFLEEYEIWKKDDDGSEESLTELQSKSECIQYFEILKTARISYIKPVLKYNIDFQNPASDECIRYVWANIIAKKFNEAMIAENRFLRYMLSVSVDKKNLEGLKWCAVDLVKCFSDDKLSDVLRNDTFIYDKVQYDNDNENVQEIMEMVKTADKCQLQMFEDWCRLAYETEYGEKYLVDFSYGGVKGYIRICPECGSHISSRLGIYEQKIISFIGMPTSGKSTLIDSIYSALNKNGQGSFNINCQFNLNDPMFNKYETSFEERENKKLATEKTAKAEHPSLTVCLSVDSKKYVYSFIDVPGEYFSAEDNAEALNDVNMYHLAVMKHSDVLCLVIASEQLIDIKSTENEASRMVKSDGNAREIFKRRIRVFKNNVLGDTSVPVFLVITKPDAIEPDKLETLLKFQEVDNEQVFGSIDVDTRVKKSDIQNLFELVKDNNNAHFDGTNIFNFEKTLEIQRLMHLFISGSPESENFLKQLFAELTGNSEIKEIPMFMVAAFGFYAANKIWNISEEEKIAAMKNNTDFSGADIEDLKIIASARDVDFSEDVSESGSNEKNELHKIQTRYKMSKSRIESLFSSYYTTRHTVKPYGIDFLIGWIFAYTDFISYCLKKDTTNDNRYLEAFNTFREKLAHYDNFEKWEIRIKNMIRTCELKVEIKSIKSSIEKKKAEAESLQKEIEALSIRSIRDIVKIADFRIKKQKEAELEKCKSEITDLTSTMKNREAELENVKSNIKSDSDDLNNN